MELATSSTRLVSFGWLLRLRWLAAAGQLGLVAAGAWLAPPQPVGALVALVAAGAVTNLVAAIAHRRARQVREPVLVALIGTDVLLLTAMLAVSDGASNPFAPVYLLYIVLAAMVLRPAWAWGAVVLAATAYGSLFLLPAGAHAHHMRSHVIGMWLAFVVSAPFLTFAITRIRGALAASEARIAEARAVQERSERLASLATLAAGAAHELATPLSTIAVVARELERRGGDVRTVDDAALIRREVDRCREVLLQLSADVGAGAGESRQPLRLGELVDGAVRNRPWVQVRSDDGALDRVLCLPRELVAQAVRRLVDNARDASPASPVELDVRIEARELVLTVVDEGPGMPPEVLARASEPFFTTKPPGQGMGLGLFFARSVAQHLGGALELRSRVGDGTRATLRVPAEAA